MFSVLEICVKAPPISLNAGPLEFGKPDPIKILRPADER